MWKNMVNIISNKKKEEEEEEEDWFTTLNHWRNEEQCLKKFFKRYINTCKINEHERKRCNLSMLRRRKKTALTNNQILLF